MCRLYGIMSHSLTDDSDRYVHISGLACTSMPCDISGKWHFRCMLPVMDSYKANSVLPSLVKIIIPNFGRCQIAAADIAVRRILNAIKARNPIKLGFRAKDL